MSSLNSLVFQDLCVLRRFIEKGRRESLFSHNEKHTGNILHFKLNSVINNVVEGSDAKDDKANLVFQDLCILRHFIKKALDISLFTSEEKPTADILHIKLCNIINEVMEKSNGTGEDEGKKITFEHQDPNM